MSAREAPPVGQRVDWFLTDRALPELKTDEVRVDRDGTVRIGGWRINLTRKTFSLTVGNDAETFMIFYTGTFHHEAGKGWIARLRPPTRGHR